MKSLLTRSAFLFLSLCGLAHGQGSLPPTVAAPVFPFLFGPVFGRVADSFGLYGTVNPNGSATTAQFEYGLTNAYGSTLPVTLLAPDGTAIQNVNALATGLSANTTYHYRLTATNAHGTSSTPDRTIRTTEYALHTNHWAGTTGGMGTTDGLGSAARFALPIGISTAPGGHYYVADGLSYTIRKITAEGMVTTFAGSAGEPGNTDGVGPSARFTSPGAVAVDAGGNVYVTDNYTIRKITSAGVVTTLAGATGMIGTTDGTGSSARFSNLYGIAVDAAGNLYVSDNQTIRKITASGIVTTLAGLAGISGTADGFGSTARFNSPEGLAMASDGHLLVADRSNHTVRRINTFTGFVSTLAGLAGVSGSTDGTASQARFASPSRLAVGADGAIYVPTYPGIRRISAAGVVSTLNITTNNFVQVGHLTVGPSGQLVFTQPVLGQGAVYVRDSTGSISVLAGLPPESGSSDGPAETARFNRPAGAGMDGDGNFYVADQANHTIRKISPTGNVTTLAGMPGVSGSTDGLGSAARFITPSDLAVDSSGNVFVATAYSVRKITPAGSVSTLANWTQPNSSYDGRMLALDGTGNVFVTYGHSIQKITSGGSLSTFAGDVFIYGSSDGTGTNARFNEPRGLAVDAADNLYVADRSNHTIRKITPSGVVTTFAGIAGTSGGEDGPSTSATFSTPVRLCLDESGNLIVAAFSTLRRISPSGEVSTIGLAELGTGVWFPQSNPSGLLSLPGGSFFVVEPAHRLERLTPGPLLGSRPVSAINATSATLNARLAPNAPTTTTALFEYGTSPSYGTAASVTLSPDSGSAEQSVSASLSGLLPATTYHYRLTATNARGTNTTSNGTFTTLNMQQGWRQTYFGSPTNEGNAADTFDHDGDGIVNLLEWATGLNPTTNSTLPASSTVSGTDIEYHYTRLVAAIAAGAIFTVEWNDTLSPLGWSSAGVVETILSNNGTTQQVKAILPAGSNGKRFVRLRVTGAP